MCSVVVVVIVCIHIVTAMMLYSVVAEGSETRQHRHIARHYSHQRRSHVRLRVCRKFHISCCFFSQSENSPVSFS